MLDRLGHRYEDQRVIEADFSSVEANKVLKNTYFLLALSMLPTIAGAILGVKTSFVFFANSPVMAVVAFLAICFGFFWGIEKTKHSAVGIAVLLAFTFFMGLFVSQQLQVALQFSNGPALISMAAGSTAVIFFSLAGFATVSKKDFSFLRQFLVVGLVVLILGAIANIWLGMSVLSLVLSAMGVLIFSGLILFDVSRIVRGGETNYISATLSVYLDILNLFMNLLNLLMLLAGERD